ncbi:MAG: hypothetical protein JWP25_2028 [Bradyrhizobium sp.]|nr:hypothetical protein [Bradyrhizobium sp.]
MASRRSKEPKALGSSWPLTELEGQPSAIVTDTDLLSHSDARTAKNTRALSAGLDEIKPLTTAALFLSANNLVARSIGIISAATSSVSSSCSHCSCSDAYRHSTAYGCAAINATAIDTPTIDATVVNANATNANASSICEGVGRDRRNACDADNSGCDERDNKSARHD